MRGVLRLLGCAALLLALWPCTAWAEETEYSMPDGELRRQVDDLPLEGWQELADEGDFPLDVREQVYELARADAEIDWQRLWEKARKALWSEADQMKPLLLLLLGPALLSALNRALLGRGTAPAAQYVCFLAEAGTLIALFVRQAELARAAMERMTRLIGQVCPVLLTLLSLSGGAGTAAVMRPLAAFACSLFSETVEKAVPTLAACVAALSVAGHMSRRIRLGSLTRLLRRLSNGLCGAFLTIMTGLVSLCGACAATRDGITVRAARYAAGTLLPAVGSEVAGAMDAVATSASLVRDAAGITGLIVLLGVCARPILRLALALVTCRAAAALAEPMDDGPVPGCLNDFAGALEMLLTALISLAVLMVVTAGGICVLRT